MRSPCTLLQAKRAQLSLSVVVVEVLQTSDHFHGYPLYLLQQLYIRPQSIRSVQMKSEEKDNSKCTHTELFYSVLVIVCFCLFSFICFN